MLKLIKQPLKFFSMSLLSFLLDYLFYIIFNLLFQKVLLANILARIISSFFNYNLNKKIVFKTYNKTSLLKYYLLVFIILLLNTYLLKILISYFLLNKYLAKILVESFLFILSYIVQKIFVFKTNK